MFANQKNTRIHTHTCRRRNIAAMPHHPQVLPDRGETLPNRGETLLDRGESLPAY